MKLPQFRGHGSGNIWLNFESFLYSVHFSKVKFQSAGGYFLTKVQRLEIIFWKGGVFLFETYE